ncbi:MAG TPA: cytochrome c peroxidase [Burkholderiales bacterium]|jgi:cytochrome c peroxidase|nr:cytochrome c peroxidase [Burkholderiales bacterium]
MKKAVLIWMALAACPAAAEAPVQFSEAERRAILAHGPWPVPIQADPKNRVSGKREAIELGERLFFDRRMSGGGKFSCGSCHIPERNWTDNQTRGAAISEVERNTPTLMNVRLGHLFGWDGATDNLAAQSVRPILDARELGSSARHVAELMRRDDQLACRYRKSFGAAPSSSDDQAVLADVGKALAAFVETFETPPTPFDQFRDSLAKGEKNAPYAEAARRGLKIFVGKGGCDNCHGGPNFTSGELRDNGFATLAAQGRADPGRNGAFKVPTLRHLLLTAPYGHHGQLGSLADVVRHYSERGSTEVGPLKLTAAEQSDLVVFLESLSTFSNPWRPEDLGQCY